MAEAAQPGGESEGATVAVKQPAERRAAARRGRRSVLKVSQLLLGAITAHRRLTPAALKRELESAGYEVRRKMDRRAGGPGRPETKGTLLRVSGIDAAGYFTVWKLLKSRRKAGRSRQALDCGSSKRPACRTSRPLRRRSCRKAAKKAREVWRRNAKALQAKARKTRSSAKSRAKSRLKDHTRITAKARVRAKTKDEAPVRARDQARAKARDQAFAKARDKAHARTKEQALARVREEACARVTDEGTDQASKEDSRPRSKDERRRSSKLREEKKQEPEKPLKRTIPKPAVTKAHRGSSGQVKARTKTSTKSEGPGSTKGNP